ncbi:hypothetical protein [Planctomicrobium sp. SH527]|uniref:hypothetical protein n=1 Tax=Planctomicrobium sp. SH527 TaxID=3448123 RepID=UPI003F5C7195
MKSAQIYIALSVVALLLSVGIVVQKSIPQEEWNQFYATGRIPPSLIPPAKAKKSQKSGEAPLDEGDEGLVAETELAPIDETVKSWDELLIRAGNVPRLSEIPWETQEIESILKRTRGIECRLTPPGTDTAPYPERLGTEELPVVSFRKTAVVVGLNVDPSAQRLLPKVSRSAIEDYLNKHMLAIQATIFQNKEGETTFAGPIQAAFVSKSSQSTTIAPEPMINDAVRNIRLLGALNSPEQQDQLAARTLVLAFKYSRDLADGLATSSIPVDEYELLFLHLPTDDYAGNGEPTIVAFATTDGRKKFMQIANPIVKRTLTPTVTASVRFDEFKLLGIYPASPVVTAVRTRSTDAVDTELVIRRLRGEDGLAQISFNKLLDEMYHASLISTSQR